MTEGKPGEKRKEQRKKGRENKRGEEEGGEEKTNTGYCLEFNKQA